MNEGSLPDHRRRYRALDDRRRLGFELERLWARIEAHADWPRRPLRERRALEASLDASPARPDAHVDHLDADVRRATMRVVVLARALRALETGAPLPEPPEPLGSQGAR